MQNKGQVRVQQVLEWKQKITIRGGPGQVKEVAESLLMEGRGP